MTMFVIVPTADVIQAMWNKSLERFSSNARLSLDGTLTLLEVETPVNDIFIDYQWYTLEEIRVVLAGASWT